MDKFPRLHIYTVAHKRADLIPLQLESFNKNLKEPFDFTVFNNNEDAEEHAKCQHICSCLGLTHIDIVKEQLLLNKYANYETIPLLSNGSYTNVNIAVAYALCFAWEKHISQQSGNICLIDSDMFLTAPVRLSDYLNRYELCFVHQSRKNSINEQVCEYMWSPGFILANLDKLPEPQSMEFWCGKVRGQPVDTGGQTYKYLEAHPDLKRMHIRSQHIIEDRNVDFHPADYEVLWMEENPCILHYRSATNWNNKPVEYHTKKTKWIASKI